jgi:NAD-dependent dihydropyrimidine dehydrogenase PreA subunit
MQIFYLKEEFLDNFLDILSKEYRVYLPLKVPGKAIKCDFGFQLPTDEYMYKIYSSSASPAFIFNPYRTVEPLRTFYAYPKEKVASYFNSTQENPQPEKKTAVLGVKNCDLFSMKIQDFVFLQGVTKDPLYEKRRGETLLISGDCPAFKESCFCLALGIAPYASEGFDLNFSPLNDGFLVDVGSPKGEGIAGKCGKCLKPATPAQVSARQQKRDAVAEKLKQHLKPHQIPPKEALQEIVTRGYNSKVWPEEALTCVECGGCNFMCDTCHCFLLSDEKFGSVNEKVRLWDACLYANFARVAGGANPLKYRPQRLRNRYLKKFDFFPQNLGLAACCGCGRCIDVCPGKIDIRRVLKRLNDEKSLSTP